MENESLKDMLLKVKPGDYEKIINHNITQEDIADFYNLFQELSLLENRYKNTILGRKEFAQELTKKLEMLKWMSELITDGLHKKKNHYEFAANELKDTEDYKKAIEVLKILANDDNIKYEIKTITFSAYDSNERHGFRETNKYTGEITILAEKEALSKIDCTKKMPILNNLTENLLMDIYKKGFSMVLVGNNEYYTEKLNIPNKYILGYYHPLVFYMQNDNLSHAISMFVNFIKDNGGDFQNISIEDIVNIIKSKYQKKLKLITDLDNHII